MTHLFALLLPIGALAAATFAVSDTPDLTSRARQPVAWRCGWFDNPTPGNVWLTDADGEWVLALQGSFAVDGLDRLPDMTREGWVSRGGPYGYGCACLRMSVNPTTRQAVIIQRGRPVPINRCRRDPALPARPGSNP